MEIVQPSDCGLLFLRGLSSPLLPSEASTSTAHQSRLEGTGLRRRIPTLQPLPFGSRALAAIPGVTTAMITAAGAAYQQRCVIGLRTTALWSLAFGILGIVGESVRI